MEGHRPQLTSSAPIEPKEDVSWPAECRSVEEWLRDQPVNQWRAQFEEDGFLVIRGVLEAAELSIYQDIYSRMLSGDIDTRLHRHDLGNNIPQQSAALKENICQIMWPSLYVRHLDQGPAHQRCQAAARVLQGPDMAHDFDMCICKSPHSNAETPWHCDQGYWLDLPDKRACSCWIAISATTLDNGCMWFAPGSHRQPMRPHQPAAPGVHVLKCEGHESEGRACPLQPGDATIHGGATRHYSRGNTTDSWRNGFIVNYRPSAMVEYEREHDFDHGYRGLDDMLAVDSGHDAEPIAD